MPDTRTISAADLKIYHFRVKIDKPGGSGRGVNSSIWYIFTAAGIDQDDAFKDAMEQIIIKHGDEDLLAVMPAEWQGSLPDLIRAGNSHPDANGHRREIVCADCQPIPTKHRHLGGRALWCLNCGRDADAHPILKGTTEGDFAEMWIRDRKMEVVSPLMD